MDGTEVVAGGEGESVVAEQGEGLPGRSITVRQAAGRARVSVAAFRDAADLLRGTDQDLRSDVTDSGDRYDVRKVDRWVQQQFHASSGHDGGTAPSIRAIAVVASWEAGLWTVTAPAWERSGTHPRLMAAQRLLADALRAEMALSPGERVEFDVLYSADHPALRTWAHAEDLRRQAAELTQRASAERLEAVLELRGQGMTPPEIASVLGLTTQRIQQILART